MFSAVHQYINQRVTDGTRRSQRTGVIAIRADGAAAAQRGMAARRDYSDELANITVPTLIVAGREDGVGTVMFANSSE